MNLIDAVKAVAFYKRATKAAEFSAEAPVAEFQNTITHR